MPYIFDEKNHWELGKETETSSHEFVQQSDEYGHWQECEVCHSRTDMLSHNLSPKEEDPKTLVCADCGYEQANTLMEGLQDQTAVNPGETMQVTDPAQTTETTEAVPANGIGAFVTAHKNQLIIGAAVAVLLIVLITVLVRRLKKRSKIEDITELGVETTESVIPETEKKVEEMVKIAKVHHIGGRANQQDSLGISNTHDKDFINSKGIMTVVADGMGGLKGGEEVSSMIVCNMIEKFMTSKPAVNLCTQLGELLANTTDCVNSYLTKNMSLKKSGSTVVSVIVKENRLAWISVGDSRIALYRNGQLRDLNARHVYGAELDEMAQKGLISIEEAQSNSHRGDLTSYMGMGKLKYISRNNTEMEVYPGDKIILMSDGIFNTLSDGEICSILSKPTSEIGSIMTSAVLEKHNSRQDNFTAIIIEI